MSDGCAKNCRALMSMSLIRGEGGQRSQRLSAHKHELPALPQFSVPNLRSRYMTWQLTAFDGSANQLREFGAQAFDTLTYAMTTLSSFCSQKGTRVRSQSNFTELINKNVRNAQSVWDLTGRLRPWITDKPTRLNSLWRAKCNQAQIVRQPDSLARTPRNRDRQASD